MCRVGKDDQPGRSSAEPIKGEERGGFYRGCCIEVELIMSWAVWRKDSHKISFFHHACLQLLAAKAVYPTILHLCNQQGNANSEVEIPRLKEFRYEYDIRIG
jgi:hypothetical protein